MKMLNTSKEYNMEVVHDIQLRQILHWNYRNLTKIPREVLDYGEHVKEIYLKRNWIRELPPEVGKLWNLTNLYLSGNQLDHLPSEIGQLRNLKVLDLSQNYLSHLPSSIGDLSFLEDFILTHNQIQTLPPELCKLRRLIFLELSSNKLRSLGEDIINRLESLEELVIDQNPLQRLPRNLSQLRRLRYLSVCQGNLIFLPGLSCFGDEDNFKRNSFLTSTTPITTTRQPILQLRLDGNPRLNYLPFWIHNQLGRTFDCYRSGFSPEDNYSLPVSKGTLPLSSSSFLPFSSSLRLFFKGKPHTLHFDEDLCQISRSRTIEPCTLVELCLRSIYREEEKRKPWSETTNTNVFPLTEAFVKSERKWDRSFIIPSKLARILRMGPIARCLQCNQPLFTQLWPLLFTLPQDNLHPNENLNQDHLVLPLQNVRQPNNNHSNGRCSIELSVVYFCSSNCILEARRTKESSSNQLLTSIHFQNEITW